MTRARLNDYLRFGYTVPKGRVGNRLQGLALSYELQHTKHRWRRVDRPVLIHTMGKVGSMALAAAVEGAGVDGVEVFHTHRLVDHADPIVRTERAGLAPRRTWYVSSALSRCIASDDRPVTVLSVVRDPLERNISGFFQTVERYLPDRRPIRPSSRPDIDRLVDSFVTNYPHLAVTTWLDREIKGNFGVDPYAEAFDEDRGFTVQRTGDRVVGIARHDRFPHAAEGMLRDTLDIANPTIERRNATDDKHVRAVVQSFKQRLRMPRDVIDELYGSPYARHFGFRPTGMSCG